MGPPSRPISSPISSTLNFAASFALPLSRSSSPAAHRRDTEASSSEASGSGSAHAYQGFGGGRAYKGRVGAGAAVGSGSGSRMRTRDDDGDEGKTAWDEAWDSSSDTEQSPRAGPSRRGGGMNGASAASTSNSTPTPAATPIPFTRTQPRHIPRPSLLNRSSSGLGVSPEQSSHYPASNTSAGATSAHPHPSSLSSGEQGGRAFSFQDISPPSPSSYKERDVQGGFAARARAMAARSRGEQERVGQSPAAGPGAGTGMAPSAPERIAGFSSGPVSPALLVGESTDPPPSVPPPQASAPLLPSAPGAILVALDSNSTGASPAPAATSSTAPPLDSSHAPSGETWTLVDGDEVEAAERAFKGLQVGGGAAQAGAAAGLSAAAAASSSRAKGKGKAGKEALKPEMMNVLADPLFLVRRMSSSAASTPTTPDLGPPSFTNSSTSSVSSAGMRRAPSVRSERRREKFIKVLEGRQAADRAAGMNLSMNGYGYAGGRYGAPNVPVAVAPAVPSTPSRTTGGVDAAELRKLAWSGAPAELRPVAWQMLLNYLPLPSQPRLTTLSRKRREYAQLVDQAFGRGLSGIEANIWHQIEIDVPRTRPGVPLWSCEVTQRSLERILYVWAIRHPASGYVQGINDLVTPFFEVFLSAYVDCDPELFDSACLPEDVLAAIEADSFWCLSKLLDGIQDNYTAHQPGIHRLVRRMSELVRRIDAPLTAHLEEQGVEFMQFAFRWMNCLLMREISVKCTIRMWDTYLSEGTDAFSQFHLYVCSAFLVKWSDRLREMDFQEIIMFLQCLPTQNWTDHDVELLLSEAFVLKSVWQGAENHFTGLPSTPLGGGMGGR